MNCPVCNSSETKVQFIKNKYAIKSCKKCGHLFTSYKSTEKEVKEIYSDNYFFNGGPGYDDYILGKDMLIKRGEYYAQKLNKYLNPGKVLDVGAAAGFILKGFENKGWDGIGIEPNGSMAEYARKEIGVNVLKGTIETIELKEQFDLVIIIQVLPHIYDLHSGLKKIFNFLNPKGYLLVETWNKDSFTAELFGKSWHEFSPPSTLNYFSKKTLNKLLTAHRFSIVDQGMPKKSINSQHAKSLIKHKLLESQKFKWLASGVRLIPDKIIIPYPGDDLIWSLYKKNE